MFKIIKGPPDLEFGLQLGRELVRLRVTWTDPERGPQKAVMASVAGPPEALLRWVRSSAHKLACHVQEATGKPVELAW